jgi:hypothetical protein
MVPEERSSVRRKTLTLANLEVNDCAMVPVFQEDVERFGLLSVVPLAVTYLVGFYLLFRPPADSCPLLILGSGCLAIGTSGSLGIAWALLRQLQYRREAGGDHDRQDETGQSRISPAALSANHADK